MRDFMVIYSCELPGDHTIVVATVAIEAENYDDARNEANRLCPAVSKLTAYDDFGDEQEPWPAEELVVEVQSLEVWLHHKKEFWMSLREKC